MNLGIIIWFILRWCTFSKNSVLILVSLLKVLCIEIGIGILFQILRDSYRYWYPFSNSEGSILVLVSNLENYSIDIHIDIEMWCLRADYWYCSKRASIAHLWPIPNISKAAITWYQVFWRGLNNIQYQYKYSWRVLTIPDTYTLKGP